jgi:AcrR family transcriptional regulator
MASTAKNQPRRRPGGRSARVLGAVVDATIDELAEGGYAALTLEAVAGRAGVNRSTVYRRWSSKESLVRAAILSVAHTLSRTPDTGSVREDLIALVRVRRAPSEARTRRAIAVALVAPPGQSELGAVLRALRRRASRPFVRVLRRAVQRRELPEDVDLALVWAPLFAMLSNEVLLDVPRSHRFFEELVDALLLGVSESASGAARK